MACHMARGLRRLAVEPTQRESSGASRALVLAGGVLVAGCTLISSGFAQRPTIPLPQVIASASPGEELDPELRRALTALALEREGTASARCAPAVLDESA
uniref:Uncharacterized protein n=1 Tax=Rhizochromulina marina TaxID=1034831 RepID=A0A7S2RR46_9STRA|mmetsp:Transcript_19872/g.58041  ORF Transcript_19872/g.58041 Transcript_19872/m.58041 type:complete len:100 (+) Transcript_19872:179-478(+)|eukprot:CAMPEP_0118963080 /NCGR_PEP_ID=MMETSP1173-20130426/1148_1 /TAXON_ID=1034831 /ORGANISM="Rhizochromulina marina cf, Strain CCMP1243" /LENGTH=99 /DNA_ID=CAMNT_0006911395 /DNA_START=179 /DNA_END=478 /DNA_ORIENTATION=-